MGAMHMGTEAEPDAGERLAAFYRERALGGAGLIVTGGWAVSREGAAGPGTGWSATRRGRAGAGAGRRVGARDRGDDRAAALPRRALRERRGLRGAAGGALGGAEPGLAGGAAGALGRRGLGGGRGLRRGRRRGAVELGFGAVEVMGSEGYLVDQFLSPLTNLREDEWGGDAERRLRFGVEVARAVRAAVGPEFPVLFRMTGAELMPGGREPCAEVCEFARGAGGGRGRRAERRRRLARIAGADRAGRRCRRGPGCRGRARSRGRSARAVPVIAGNRVNRLERGGGGCCATEEIDFVSMSRPFLADPELVARGRDGRPVDVCIACNQACIDRSIVDEHVSCLVNPRAGYEREFPLPRGARQATTAADVGRFAVIGGGPAGLEAARSLARLGATGRAVRGRRRARRPVPLRPPGPGQGGLRRRRSSSSSASCRGSGSRSSSGARSARRTPSCSPAATASCSRPASLPRRSRSPAPRTPRVLDYHQAFERGVGDAHPSRSSAPAASASTSPTSSPTPRPRHRLPRSYATDLHHPGHSRSANISRPRTPEQFAGDGAAGDGDAAERAGRDGDRADYAVGLARCAEAGRGRDADRALLSADHAGGGRDRDRGRGGRSWSPPSGS